MSTDHQILRKLATRWMEISHWPVMAERQRLWRAAKDLHAERPMVNFETATLEDYLLVDELQCTNEQLRQFEHFMSWQIRHAEEVGDDFVMEPAYRIPWQINASNYGVDISGHSAQDTSGAGHAYSFTHPIQSPADLEMLQPRKWQVDRQKSEEQAALLEEIIGDILPVQMGGVIFQHAALTQDSFKLLGNENLLSWPYEEPEALHQLMGYLRDDRKAYFNWLEKEKLLGLNNNWTFIGSACGYTSDLPQADFTGTVRICDQWCWMESQETAMHSPDMFGEFFLPYMAEVANLFGLVYYGCCEPVHDRWDQVAIAIPRVRAVSVSCWCNMQQVAEAFGQNYLFSRKPNPVPMSGMNPDWAMLENDIDETLAAAANCNLEFIFRDVYRIHGDRPRLRRWVELVRSRIGGSCN